MAYHLQTEEDTEKRWVLAERKMWNRGFTPDISGRTWHFINLYTLPFKSLSLL
jgi:hypothetical protein